MPALASRGLRLLAIAAVAVLASAVTALDAPGRAVALVLITLALAALTVWLWPRSNGALSSSAAVLTGTTALVAAQRILTPTGDAANAFLLAAGAVAVAAAYALRERRLAVLGLLQWLIVVGRPIGSSGIYRHCLVLTQLSVPLPRLREPLVLATLAVAVGTWHRWSGRHVEVGRALEAFGAVAAPAALVLLAWELPGHRALCGPGDAVDEGWAVAALAVALVMAAYGLVGRDALWASAGVLTLAVAGVTLTVLSDSVTWALVAGAPLVAGLAVAERAGIGWPAAPGYGQARPTASEVASVAARLRRSAGTSSIGRDA